MKPSIFEIVRFNISKIKKNSMKAVNYFCFISSCFWDILDFIFDI